MPKRIQRRRTKGWKMPDGAVSVTRPGVFGNPFTPAGYRAAGYEGTDRDIAQRCIEAFAIWCDRQSWFMWRGEESDRSRKALLAALPSLRGKDLACWCKLCDEHRDGLPLGVVCEKCEPCHSNVLLELANK